MKKISALKKAELLSVLYKHGYAISNNKLLDIREKRAKINSLDSITRILKGCVR